MCRGPLVQNAGAGRRRLYCSTACRRRAQRNRQARRVPLPTVQGPLGAEVAAEVRRLAQQLLDSEVRQEELATLLARADAIRRELEIYTAAAVQDARHRGEKWEAVGKAAHVAPETARARWGPERVARMMDLHANDKRAAPARWRGPQLARLADVPEEAAGGPNTVGVASPAGQLASALEQLQATSGLTIREIADRTMLSPSFISRVLSGDRLPTWDLTCSLAVLFGADPAELRVLFEAAHGMTVHGRQPVAVSIEQLHAAVRGLHRAAKSPSPERIEQYSRKAVTALQARRVLSGIDVPEWEVLAALVCALGGRPHDFKPLWEAVHYTFLMCDDPRLPEGTAHIAVPEEEP